jgi:hypothetical protein
VLRFTTDTISKMTGIPFKKVCVEKSIWFDGNEHAPTPRMTNLYSFKVLGQIKARSIMNTSSEVRFIPPPNFVSLLARSCHIHLGRKVVEVKKGRIMTEYVGPKTKQGKSKPNAISEFEYTEAIYSRFVSLIIFHLTYQASKLNQNQFIHLPCNWMIVTPIQLYIIQAQT